MDYIEYICKTVPARERAIEGLCLKLIFSRMDNDKILEEKIKIKLNKIRQMTDEEYDNMKDKI